MKSKAVSNADYHPYAALNVFIFIAASSVAFASLYYASHSQSWYGILIAVVTFSFINNTLFSLLHESVHFSFSKNRAVNDFFGVLIAAFFPTGLYYQRVCHLGHHARNRTDDEMFDLYYPDDNKFLKRLQLYCILTPLYWASIVLGCVLYLLFPYLYDSTKALRQNYRWLDRAGLKMLEPFARHPRRKRIRLEILYTLLFQVGMFWVLNLTWTGWLLCYLAFAFNWCAVQYADHAWSERDIIKGAWNLKVNKLVQYLFLNYHHHAAHHEQPNLPWVHLHKFVDFSGPRPSFVKIYLELWRGPKPTNVGEPKPVSNEFLGLLWDNKDHSDLDRLIKGE